MKRELLALVCVGALSAPALRAADARQLGGGTAAAAQATGAQAPPAAGAPDDKPDEKVTRKEEITVESASKAETTIVDAPATMTRRHRARRSRTARPRTTPTCCAASPA